MRKIMGFWVAVAVFSLLLTGSPALAGPKGQGQAKGGGQGAGQAGQGNFTDGQPKGWGQGKKSGWEKKGSTIPPGLQKKDQLPKGLQKKAPQ
jgi:hypothetical protein